MGPPAPWHSGASRNQNQPRTTETSRNGERLFQKPVLSERRIAIHREERIALPRQRQKEVSRGSRARRSNVLANPTPGTQSTNIVPRRRHENARRVGSESRRSGPDQRVRVPCHA